MLYILFLSFFTILLKMARFQLHLRVGIGVTRRSFFGQSFFNVAGGISSILKYSIDNTNLSLSTTGTYMTKINKLQNPSIMDHWI